jgi:hypothetical protein
MLRVVAIFPGTPVYGEGDAAEVITPGHVVEHNGSGGIIKNLIAASANVPVMVAVENDMFGGGLDDNYAVGARVLYQHLLPGAEFHGLVAAAAPAIAYDDWITTAAGGTLVKAASEATAIGRACAALDNSAGGTAARLRVRVK